MNRRAFLSTLVGGVAAAAAVRTFPFRVYSFPKEPVRIAAWEKTYIDAFRLQMATIYQVPPSFLCAYNDKSYAAARQLNAEFFKHLVHPYVELSERI